MNANALEKFLKQWAASGWIFYTTKIRQEALEGKLGRSAQVSDLERVASGAMFPLAVRRSALEVLRELRRHDAELISFERVLRLRDDLEQAANIESIFRLAYRDAEARRYVERTFEKLLHSAELLTKNRPPKLRAAVAKAIRDACDEKLRAPKNPIIN